MSIVSKLDVLLHWFVQRFSFLSAGSLKATGRESSVHGHFARVGLRRLVIYGCL